MHARELRDIIINHQMYVLQLRPAVLESINAHVNELSTSHSVIHVGKGKRTHSSLNTILYWISVKTVIH